EVRKKHSSFGMVGMRQRVESLWEQILLADFLGAHRCQLLPGHRFGQLDANAFLQRLATLHRDTSRRPVAEVVALAKEIGLPLLDRRFRRLHAGHDRRKWFRDVQLRIACLALFLGIGDTQGDSQSKEQTGKRRHCPWPAVRSWIHGTSSSLKFCGLDKNTMSHHQRLITTREGPK